MRIRQTITGQTVGTGETENKKLRQAIECLPVLHDYIQTESRSISVDGSRIRFGSELSPRIRWVMTRAAVIPISTIGTSMVVSGGFAYWLISILLMPITATCPGTETPSLYRALSAAIAIRSLAA